MYHRIENDDIWLYIKLTLEKIEGIGTIRANSIKRFTDFSKAEEEIKFIEKLLGIRQGRRFDVF